MPTYKHVPIINITKVQVGIWFGGVNQLFKLKPCKVDALRLHELITTIREDGTCHFTHKDGEIIELNISKDIITLRALELKEGNHSINSMKPTFEVILVAFKSDKVGEGMSKLSSYQSRSSSNASTYIGLRSIPIWMHIWLMPCPWHIGRTCHWKRIRAIRS